MCCGILDLNLGRYIAVRSDLFYNYTVTFNIFVHLILAETLDTEIGQ